jgi:hypothetical protein
LKTQVHNEPYVPSCQTLFFTLYVFSGYYTTITLNLTCHWMESALVLCATSISLFVSPFARPLTSYLSYPPCINRLSFRRSHIHVSTTASVPFDIVPVSIPVYDFLTLVLSSTLASCFVIVHVQFLLVLMLVSNQSPTMQCLRN